jgi:lysophospholipase L1-like esterase
MTTRARIVTMRTAAAVLGVVLGVGLAEGIARLVGPGRALDELASALGRRVPDPILDYRVAPHSAGHDARGHRNAASLERADVVALGDSQTWGINASINESWPAQLATQTGLRVYNMGRGGYGMVEYRHQLDEALALDPEWIVVALYFGNDVWEAYDLVYSLPAHAALRHPDATMRERIEQSPQPDVQRMLFERLQYQRSWGGLLMWLEEHSVLGRLLLNFTATPADTDADLAWAADHPDEGFVFDSDGITTVFHTSYRLGAVDSSLAQVREGLRILRKALIGLHERMASEERARLLVVLLPTKERIFARAVGAAGIDVPASYGRIVAEEARISEGLLALMEQEGIRHLDLLPALEQAVARREATHPPNADGHFSPAGYRQIARAIAQALAAGTP